LVSDWSSDVCSSDLYVNHFTEDMGDEGRKSIARLLEAGHAAGKIPAVEVEYIY